MKKQTTIAAAKKLLEANGWIVKKDRPEPKIGDVIRTKDGDRTMDVLITFHHTDITRDYGTYPYGGVEVSKGKWNQQCIDPLWIDREEWAKDDGQYEVVGHVDLSKFIKIH